MSVIFPPPFLRAPGIFWFFLLANPHAHKTARFRGGRGFFGKRGGEVPIFFMGVGIFPTNIGIPIAWYKARIPSPKIDKGRRK